MRIARSTEPVSWREVSLLVQTLPLRRPPVAPGGLHNLRRSSPSCGPCPFTGWCRPLRIPARARPSRPARAGAPATSGRNRVPEVH